MIHGEMDLIFTVSGVAIIEFPRWPKGIGWQGSRGARTRQVFHSTHIVWISAVK